MVMPFLRRPSERAVLMARGMVAAVVLPYSPMLMMIFSSGMPRRSAVAMMMRLLA